MNRLEFNEVMKELGINKPLAMATGKYGTKESVYYWQDIAICFSGSYYAVIKGQIPLEVANIIYKKYPNNPYEIRVNGGCSDWMPSKWSTNKFINLYHIDTKEGLVILLTEMKDYWARKEGKKETAVQRFPELMTSINSEILKKVNPYITTYEWMQEDNKNKKLFWQTFARENQTPLGRLLRKAIDRFDKTVNPFINDDIVLEEMETYLKKVEIIANVKDADRKDCCKVDIIDLETKNKVNFCRYPESFFYQLQYKLEENNYFIVLHYYSTIDEGEIIEIIHYNMPHKMDIKYNLTKGVIGTTYGEKKPITSEQKEYIYNELLKANILASSITINNMQKKDYSKELSSNK